MTYPTIIPSSRDPQDTRPDASGRVPGVHYNVPMDAPLPYQQGFDANSVLAMILGHPAQAASKALGFYLHGGGTRQGNQMDLLTNLLRHSGVPSRSASSIAENLVYRPYNRPT